ncbi:hypothetical protein LINPERHAP2_LOCUS21233 [Linum perenne]
MHYNGVLQEDEYVYGLVAYLGDVVPDLFSMLELSAMGRSINVDRDYYQYLWLPPGKEIIQGLKPLECEDDIWQFINNLDGALLIKVFVKKMTHFQAWKRMFKVKMALYKRLTEPSGGSLEIQELGESTFINEVGNTSESGVDQVVAKSLMIQWIGQDSSRVERTT